MDTDPDPPVEFDSFTRRPLGQRILVACAWAACAWVLCVLVQLPFVDWSNDTVTTKFGRGSFSPVQFQLGVAMLATGLLAALATSILSKRHGGVIYGIAFALPLAVLFMVPFRSGARDAVGWIQAVVPTVCVLILGGSFGREYGRQLLAHRARQSEAASPKEVASQPPAT